MGRRYQTRGLAKDRIYTLKMAARTIGSSEATIRKYGKQGLRVIRDSRPHLVRGADLIEFLQKREAANRNNMADGQFYCMKCKAPRDAVSDSIVFTAYSPLTGRLSGVCGVCGGKMGRFCKTSDAPSGGSNPPGPLQG